MIKKTYLLLLAILLCLPNLIFAEEGFEFKGGQLFTPEMIESIKDYINGMPIQEQELREIRDAANVWKRDSDNSQIELREAKALDMQTQQIDNVLDPTAAQDAATKNYIDVRLPAGTISMYGGSSAPAGWLECDGSAVSRTTYATLYAAISTTYGVGNGSTTFNLPTFTNKFARGNTPGTGAGADTHSHADTLAAPAHTHSVPRDGWGSAHQTGFVGRIKTIINTTLYDSATGDNTSGAASATALTGSVTDGANVPVYTAVMFIIKQ